MSIANSKSPCRISMVMIAGVLLFLSGQGQAWLYTYNGPANFHDRLDDIIYGNDHNVYAVGYSDYSWPGNPGNLTVVSLTSAGSYRWMYSYPRKEMGNGALYYCIVMGADGNLYACGDSIVVSLTPDGVQRWVYTQIDAHNMVFGGDGNLYCCGEGNVASLTTSGAERWKRSGLTRSYELAYGPDGNIYVAGVEDSKFSVQSWTTTGTERWTYQYAGSLEDDLAYTVITGPDSSVYAAGRILTDHHSDLLVVSLSPAMTEKWTYTYSSPGYNMDMAGSIIMGTDGNLYLAGFGGYGAYTRDIVAMSLTRSGVRRWYYNYNGPAGNFDNCHEITCGLDGHIYIAGTALASTDDFLILYLTRFGCERRTAYLYDGPAHNSDEAYAVAYGGTDSLFTCGTTYNVGNNEDFIIMGHDVSLPATNPGEISANPAPLIIDYDDFKDRPQPSHLKTVMKAVSLPVIEPALAGQIQRAASDEFVPIIVQISERADLISLEADASQVGKTARREWVSSQLKMLSQRSQRDILSHLETMASQGRVIDIASLWMVNAVSAKVEMDVIYKLAKTAGISSISLDCECYHILGDVSAACTDALSGREIVWGVQKIQANAVWNLGYTGKGIIVGILDTGVSWAHQDLNDHLWDGGVLYSAHGYDFVNRDKYPSDDHGHGTHVAGIVAGDGTAGSQTGVAPDARIMAIKVLNASGAGSLTWIIEGLQFAIDHGADVINMSLGADSASNAIKDYCRDMCRIAYIADVPLAVSAGNGKGGSNHYIIPYDITCPGDVPSPWFAPNGGRNAVISTGATDEADVVAGFSSYGPTQWNTGIYTDYLYPPGLKKPDVSAPGVSIKSLLHNNISGYTIMSGTSMAAPHLAGTIALMLEKNRFLTCREIDSLIETTALDLGAAGRDNYYGAGRINALNAVNAVIPSKWPSGSFYIRNAPGAPGNLEFDMHLSWTEAWIKSATATSFVLVPGESTKVTVYVDTTGMPNNTTWYDTIWIYSNDPDISFYPEPVWLVRGIIGVEEPSYPKDHSKMKHGTAFLRISPNPFKEKTEIKMPISGFALPCSMADQAENMSQIMLKIYDTSGQLVKSFKFPSHNSLPAAVIWEGDDSSGCMLPQGVYFVQFKNGMFEATGKTVLLR